VLITMAQITGRNAIIFTVTTLAQRLSCLINTATLVI